MQEHGKPGQGIGARVLRKEDSRHLHGRGQYVSDMMLPGQREVAFLRSPVAHGRIRGITKPSGPEGRVFVREDLVEAKDIIAPSTLPTSSSPANRRLRTAKCASLASPS